MPVKQVLPWFLLLENNGANSSVLWDLFVHNQQQKLPNPRNDWKLFVVVGAFIKEIAYDFRVLIYSFRGYQ